MGTNLVSGLASGIDWQSMVTQLIAIDHKRVDLIGGKKSSEETKLAAWQFLNTKLLALKTAAGNLKTTDDFSLFKATTTSSSAVVKAADLLAVTTSPKASVGSYAVKVNSLAAAEKLSSGSFASMSKALGADYAGDLLINSKVITITATDTLADVSSKINNANSGTNPIGVTAGIVSYASGDNRLVLTSGSTGSTGISLLNGGANDILNQFGFTDTSRSAKNRIAGADRSDGFNSTEISIKSLLGLSTTRASGAGEIVINGQAIAAIDLGTDTLSTLQTKFAAAGLTVSITTEQAGNQSKYRLMVSGAANTYTDKNNILETLGFIEGGLSDVVGVTGDTANTSGGAVITADTLLKDIDGYTGYSSSDYIHLEGKNTNDVDVSDDTFILSDTTTVGDLLLKIENLFGHVTATITGEGKLRIVDNSPGASRLAVKIGVKDAGGSADDTLKFESDSDLGSAGTIRKRQIVAGADASLTIDGVGITRSVNQIDDVLAGVTLDLLKADTETTVTLNIGRDIEAIADKINTFVSSYNSVSSFIRTQTSYDDTKMKAGGVLFGDGTIASIKWDLTSILTRQVWGVSSDYSTMGLVGISVDREGKLSVDSGKLRGYLSTNFNDLLKLFTASGETSAGTLSFISHGQSTKAGEYAVHIDTVATRSTSAASDNTSLAGDETLTITEGESTAIVSLTSGMTMSQMVNAVNSELAMGYAQALAGSESLYADAGQAAFVTSATKWNSIYDIGGAAANLADDDVISFTGTTRNGMIVNGSYKIGNAAEDSVQELLSAIEATFSNQVAATINASGQIIVTDKTTGHSSISLELVTTQAHDLNFGTVTKENTGGREGRYAMEITASVDAGNHMVLTHNNYGSGSRFIITQQNNLLWTSGDQTVDNGRDVAGTINGEAATGTGQLLTGNNGGANVSGLTIRYTGTSGGVDAGKIKLTYGVAELYDRALFNITDSLEGYVPFKNQSIQDKIKRYETQIEEMEARLKIKSDMMIERYVAMELVLQSIQNQSSWLLGQTTAAAKGWMEL